MKLLNCLKCNDIIVMLARERACMCGECKGKLEAGGVVFIGKGRVFSLRWADYLKAAKEQETPWMTL